MTSRIQGRRWWARSNQRCEMRLKVLHRKRIWQQSRCAPKMEQWFTCRWTLQAMTILRMHGRFTSKWLAAKAQRGTPTTYDASHASHASRDMLYRHFAFERVFDRVELCLGITFILYLSLFFFSFLSSLSPLLSICLYFSFSLKKKRIGWWTSRRWCTRTCTNRTRTLF